MESFVLHYLSSSSLPHPQLLQTHAFIVSLAIFGGLLKALVSGIRVYVKISTFIVTVFNPCGLAEKHENMTQYTLKAHKLEDF